MSKFMLPETALQRLIEAAAADYLNQQAPEACAA
jgi:hypothetical protein